MATKAETAFIFKLSSKTKGPILEVGSAIVQPRDKTGRVDFRDFWPGQKYVGVDAMPGDGVDVVTKWPPEDIANYRERFETVLCVSCLEHATDPWSVAWGVITACKVGGTIVVTAPFVHAYHPYPEDYWRFTPEGLKLLFGDRVAWNTIGLLSQRHPLTFEGNDEILWKVAHWKTRLKKRTAVLENKMLPYPVQERMVIGLVGTRLS